MHNYYYPALFFFLFLPKRQKNLTRSRCFQISRRKFSKSVDYRFLSLFKRRRSTRIDCDSKRIRIEKIVDRKKSGEKRVFRSSLITHLLSREEEKSSFLMCYTCLDCATLIALLDFRNARFLATFKDEIASFETSATRVSSLGRYLFYFHHALEYY